MKRLLLLSLLVLFVTSQANAYKKLSIDIPVNGKNRNMVVFTPNTFPEKSPLFIVTHGMNQNPEYQYGADKMYEMIDTAKFVVTYLRSDGNTWDIWGTNDQTFVIKAIDEMVSRYNIDRERVYWTGFSMGSMLLHHCIGNMQSKIAAFAPTSGIMQDATPWTSCNKPVNLLEVIAYGDDVFKYEQFGIHSYIENYAKHDKHTSYTKTTGYKPISSSWFDGDLEKWTGGTNGGEVWLYSYNNGGHWPMEQNRHLIWSFCKRFSLNMPTTRITAPTGETTHLCMAPKAEVSFPDIAVKATAKAPNSKVAKVVFYDGKKLIDSVKTSPYEVTVAAPAVGKHSLRAEVIAENGKRSSYTCLVNNVQSQATYTLSTTFKTEGTVPQNWYVSNGQTKRTPSIFPVTSGCRLLRFTNSVRAFQYGLLVQNTMGKEKAAWAKFGTKEGRSALTLHTGHYIIKYKVCNWNQPSFTPVTVAVETTGGVEVASQTYTPTVNIGNKVGNSFTGVTQQTFEFDIPERGDYVIVFYAGATKNADFVLGTLTIQAKSFVTTGIVDVDKSSPSRSGVAYDLRGRKLSTDNLKPGLYIIDGRKTIIR